ncbi:hypothetical protein GCM10023201_06810 [Actinomycetospora corticicola]|uniref:HNH nuclease domain-containing protein n=1 Tax=Actinomycetospora corticicola TaxID=663602 RepID=A0A7Y9DTZ1_9PSEU|nr:HNH endonuclease signature motif containing protein [Actinomycetospora corticicola]NYD35480.1 hypothetical protein [Actinomycetospora corticicola]
MTTAVAGPGGAEGGPEAAPRAGVGPEGLPGQWVDAGLSVQFTLANIMAWRLCRWLLECSRARAGTAERVTSRPRAGKIVAASLGWSESYGAARVEFARQVLERLPVLGEQMQSGRLEERKASIVVDLVADLDDDQARAVVEEIVESAPSLGYAALRALVGRVAMAVDPAWAERRRAAGIARRRVALRSAPSGAAELCGLDLPEDPAQDAHDRIVALAHEVLRRLKRAGIGSVSVGTAESEVMLTLTGPAGAGMYDLDVVEYVVAALGGPTDPDPDDTGPGPDPDDPDDRGPDDEPGPEGPDGDHGPDGPDDQRGGDGPDDPRGDGPGDRVGPGGGLPQEGKPDGAGGGQPAVVAFRARTVLRMELRGVLGLDRSPGELPGRGPITHRAAVAMARARTHTRWRIRLHDPHGHLEHVLSFRPPSAGPPPAGGRRHAHIVELTAFTSDLDTLTAQHTDTRDPGVLDPDAVELLRRARRALDKERARPADEHPARTRSEAGHRFPSTRLRDWVQARDDTCHAPGCAVDAVSADLDHTRPVIDGGLTLADDLGPLCRRDHLLKSDPTSGWTVTQTAPGHFEWTSPTGRVHLKTPYRYRPLPAPVPRTGPRRRLPEHLPRPKRPGTPRANQHGHITDPAFDTAWHLATRTDRTAYAGDDPPF